MPLINIGKPRVLQKTKIGREVKGIPGIWLKKSGDTISDNVIIDKYPYFFKYRYANARKDLQKYNDEANTSCKRTYKMTIDELISKQYRTVEEQQTVNNYYKYMPLVYSNSSMNILCRYIESVNFEIAKKIKEISIFDFESLYIDGHEPTEEEYSFVKSKIKEFMKRSKTICIDGSTSDDMRDEKISGKCPGVIISTDELMDELIKDINDAYVITNCFIRYYYEDVPKSNKDLLWHTVGKYIVSNMINSGDGYIEVPVQDKNGDIEFLNKRYRREKIEL